MTQYWGMLDRPWKENKFAMVVFLWVELGWGLGRGILPDSLRL